MGYEKSGLSFEDYIEKLIWLEEVSLGMQISNVGSLVWVSYFDGEYFTIAVNHVSE